MTPIGIAKAAEENGYPRCLSVVLPMNHFGEVWSHPEDDGYIWHLIVLDRGGRSVEIGNGMALSLSDATSALFSYVQCWIMSGENLPDMREGNLAVPVTIPDLGFKAAERRRKT